MPDQPPPTRYKVIERDRRLIVIDTQEQGAVSAPSPIMSHVTQSRAVAPPSGARPISTTALFAMLFMVSTSVMIYILSKAPWLFVLLAFALFQPRLRAGLRGAVAGMMGWLAAAR